MYEDLLSERLSKLRNAKGVSAREMSLAIGQNESFINRIENGKALPSMQSFFYICEYLKVTPSEFFATEDTLNSNALMISKDLEGLSAEQIEFARSMIADLKKLKK